MKTSNEKIVEVVNKGLEIYKSMGNKADVYNEELFVHSLDAFNFFFARLLRNADYESLVFELNGVQYEVGWIDDDASYENFIYFENLSDGVISCGFYQFCEDSL